MGNQEEGQEGASVNHRNHEGSEGSNAPNKPDVIRPFVADTASPHIVEEMKMMKERIECMMSALKGRVFSDLDDLIHRIDSPFTTSVNSFPLLPKF